MRLVLSTVFLPFFYQFLLASAQGTCSSQTGVQFTNYGFPDASGLTQFGCSSGQPNTAENIPTPLGDGSHSRPFSAASGTGSTLFPGCSTVYIPYFQKYFRFVDNCGACGSAPDSHIDLYLIQSNADIGQTDCEKTFGNFGNTGHTVVTNPGPDMPYNSAPLFEGGTCYSAPSQGRVFSDTGTTGCGGTPNDPNPSSAGAVSIPATSAVIGEIGQSTYPPTQEQPTSIPLVVQTSSLNVQAPQPTHERTPGWPGWQGWPPKHQCSRKHGQAWCGPPSRVRRDREAMEMVRLSELEMIHVEK